MLSVFSLDTCVTLAVDGNPYLPIGSPAVFVLFPAHDDAGQPFGDRMEVSFVWQSIDGEILTGAGRHTLDELAAKIDEAQGAAPYLDPNARTPIMGVTAKRLQPERR